MFAPSAAIFGRVFPKEVTPGGVFLYLSPRLEALPQEEVDFTVAHDRARRVRSLQTDAGKLNAGVDFETHDDAPTEREADRYWSTEDFFLDLIQVCEHLNQRLADEYLQQAQARTD